MNHAKVDTGVDKLTERSTDFFYYWDFSWRL